MRATGQVSAQGQGRILSSGDSVTPHAVAIRPSASQALARIQIPSARRQQAATSSTDVSLNRRPEAAFDITI